MATTGCWRIASWILERKQHRGLRRSRSCAVGASHNGQAGLDCGSGTDNRFEDVTTLYNNRKLFSIDWGGAGNKLCQTRGNTVRGLVSAFNNTIQRNLVVEPRLAALCVEQEEA
jgi:hypothetical protein